MAARSSPTTARRLVASALVYLAPDDAKSDVILAAATSIVGVALYNLVTSFPLYPSSGTARLLLDVMWLAALTSLVPLLLARHRGDASGAFSLDKPRTAAANPGLLLAAPVVALAVVQAFRLGIGLEGVLLGRALVFDLLTILTIPVLAAGALLFVTFVANRSAQGFPRSPETSLTELLRVYGTGSLVAAMVLGLLLALQGGIPAAGTTLLHGIALAAMLAVADRQVTPRMLVPRTTVVTPVVVVAITHVFVVGGGLFGGGRLLYGLYTAALAAGTTVAMTVVSRSKAGGWALVPLVVALAWWPTTCLSPLALAPGMC